MKSLDELQDVLKIMVPNHSVVIVQAPESPIDKYERLHHQLNDFQKVVNERGLDILFTLASDQFKFTVVSRPKSAEEITELTVANSPQSIE